jgi:hypothetical protein
MTKTLISRYHLLIPHEFPSMGEFGRDVMRDFLRHPYEVPLRMDSEPKLNQSFSFTRFQNVFIMNLIKEGMNFSLYFRSIVEVYLDRFYPETINPSLHPHAKALFLRYQQRKADAKEILKNKPNFQDIPMEIINLAKKHGADWIG